jgi:hypothetical protein
MGAGDEPLGLKEGLLPDEASSSLEVVAAMTCSKASSWNAASSYGTPACSNARRIGSARPGMPGKLEEGRREGIGVRAART